MQIVKILKKFKLINSEAHVLKKIHTTTFFVNN